jgi:RNA polymerase sigma-70 factor (ECF subfamily)
MTLAAGRTEAQTGREKLVSYESREQPFANAEYTWLFREEFPTVVGTAFLILHDRQGAEDVAQQAFTQLLVHWRKVSSYDRPDAWVRRVAIRLAVRALRRDRLRTVLQQRVEASGEATYPDMDIVHALKGLPPQQRAAVALFYFEDRPIQEIAGILNCSESTTKAHLFKARRRLASLLREDEGEILDVS